MNAELWSPSSAARLRAARTLSPDELENIQRSLAANCPVTPWPYGNGTVINPLLVTLGISPGGSPESGDEGPKEDGGHAHPTSGVPHPGTWYKDTKGYWDKIRFLARTMLPCESNLEEDALSLFGNLNLSPRQSGDSRNVELQPDFVAWLLALVRYRLRPQIVVMLGLKKHLEKIPSTAEAIERCFPGFNPRKPHRKVQLECYKKSRWFFDEWDIPNLGGGKITLVMWPQHPSRVPFTNTALWEESCREFSKLHRIT